MDHSDNLSTQDWLVLRGFRDKFEGLLTSYFSQHPRVKNLLKGLPIGRRVPRTKENNNNNKRMIKNSKNDNNDNISNITSVCILTFENHGEYKRMLYYYVI